MFISSFSRTLTANFLKAVLSQHLGDYSLSQSAMSCYLNAETCTSCLCHQHEVMGKPRQRVATVVTCLDGATREGTGSCESVRPSMPEHRDCAWEFAPAG